MAKRLRRKWPAKYPRFEGAMGEEGKKGRIELSRLLDRPYSKTVDGPRLFATLDYSTARTWKHGKRGSRSFDKLLRTLGV